MNLSGGLSDLYFTMRFVRPYLLALFILCLPHSLYYWLVKGWSWQQSLFFSVETGMSIGFGVFNIAAMEKTDLEMLLTIFHIFVCTAIVMSTLSYATSTLLGSRFAITIAFLIWMVIGIIFGIQHEGHLPIKAFYMANGAMAGGGHIGPDPYDNDALFFLSLYCIIGCPLYSVFFSRWGEFLINLDNHPKKD
jgi:hypothetical protein